jgi:hypothetical protein
MEQSADILLNYNGQIDYSVHEELLDQTKSLLENRSIDIITKSRLIYIVIEGLENIFRHAVNHSLSDFPDQFTIKQINNEFIITIGNLLENYRVKSLTQKIETVNSLDSAGLKKTYRDTIKNTKITDDCGSGLGILRIAMKSGQKIQYQFSTINSEESYFIMEIHLQKT